MGRLEPVIGTNIIVTPKGDEIRLGHTWHEVDVLKYLITDTDPDGFVEIGVHEGGLSYLLIDFIQLGCHYIGIEYNCNLIRPEVKKKYTQHPLACLLCMDCFNPYLGMFPTGKIIYCDGGNKPKELLHFKSACNPGDLILTHDFWDGYRKVRDVPDENISKEVLPIDIVHMDTDPTFERLDEDIFKETRIVGWRKL